MYFVSNNSSQSRKEYISKFQKLGFHVNEVRNADVYLNLTTSCHSFRMKSSVRLMSLLTI